MVGLVVPILSPLEEKKDAEMKEIIIDVPLAINKMLLGFSWPLQALGELKSGALTAKDSEISVSPR